MPPLCRQLRAQPGRGLGRESPAYFNEGPAQHDWAVLALRRSLGQARTGAAPQTALPLVREPVDRRLPGPVAAADAFAADQLPEYRSPGPALMTMQAPRYRAALDRVLDAIVARMTAVAEAAAPAPELDDRFGGEAPDALSAEDAAFTEQFRKEVAPVLPAAPVARTLDIRGPVTVPSARPHDGAAPPERVLAAERMPELGRRILLVGPAGAGHSTELARLAGGRWTTWRRGGPARTVRPGAAGHRSCCRRDRGAAPPGRDGADALPGMGGPSGDGRAAAGVAARWRGGDPRGGAGGGDEPHGAPVRAQIRDHVEQLSN